ncbi:hypothetical protein KKB44_02640 [Candidatus Micrarchaeota archaeon]|nr:hypothetical protein [Candidatus Micrarchaeota archaeon]
MINQKLLDRLQNGDANAVATVTDLIDRRHLSQSQIIQLWECTIKAALRGVDAVNPVGFKLAETGEVEIRDIYEDLFALTIFSHLGSSFRQTISTGANVVKVQNDCIKCRDFDKERYLELAKRCLINVVKNGHENSQVFAVEGLRNFEDRTGIREELLRIAQRKNDAQLMKAIEGSLAEIRIKNEIEIAHADRKLILETDYYDDTTPGKLYIDIIFGAVETVFTDMGKNNYAVMGAIVQLSRAGIKSANMDGILDVGTQQIIAKNIENALLHALTHGTEEMREEAKQGLVEIGSDRTMQILDRIAERERNEIGKTARTAFARIHSKKYPGIAPPPPPSARKAIANH